jgi:hypothetical protein
VEERSAFHHQIGNFATVIVSTICLMVESAALFHPTDQKLVLANHERKKNKWLAFTTKSATE